MAYKHLLDKCRSWLFTSKPLLKVKLHKRDQKTQKIPIKLVLTVMILFGLLWSSFIDLSKQADTSFCNTNVRLWVNDTIKKKFILILNSTNFLFKIQGGSSMESQTWGLDVYTTDSFGKSKIQRTENLQTFWGLWTEIRAKSRLKSWKFSKFVTNFSHTCQSQNF